VKASIKGLMKRGAHPAAAESFIKINSVLHHQRLTSSCCALRSASLCWCFHGAVWKYAFSPERESIWCKIDSSCPNAKKGPKL